MIATHAPAALWRCAGMTKRRQVSPKALDASLLPKHRKPIWGDVDEWCGWRSNARIGIVEWCSDSRWLGSATDLCGGGANERNRCNHALGGKSPLCLLGRHRVLFGDGRFVLGAEHGAHGGDSRRRNP